MPFEFVIDGPAVSGQADSDPRRQWIEAVRGTARQLWGDRSPLSGELSLVIVNFYRGRAPDLDNMAKPILDALEGVVYVDDFQVCNLTCRHRHVNSDMRVSNPFLLQQERLFDRKPFVYISVDSTPNEEVAI